MSKQEIVELGLIGYPLIHSFSPGYFSEKFARENITGYRYNLYPITSSFHFYQMKHYHPGIQGLNVTIPYKESIIPFIDELDAEAEAIGAVNTIVYRDGKTIGYNTDVMGFLQSLQSFLDSNEKKPAGALILGTGGAAKAVAHGLKKVGIDFKLISRTPKDQQLGYGQIDQNLLNDFPLIVNTTPLGTFPKIDLYPEIPYHLLNANNLLFDLIYNPEKTLFLTRGEEKGAAIQNGLDMLKAQAELSWSLWTS